MATYYIVENYQQAGPFTLEQLSARGITPETSVWTEGMANWTPANQVSELQCLFVPQPPISPEPSYGASSAYSGSSSSSSSDEYVPMPKDNKSSATTELIVSIVTSFCCLNLLSVGGIVFGILGITEAGKVSTFYSMNNYTAAQKASDDAAKWVRWGYIIDVIGIILGILIVGSSFVLPFILALMANM